MILKIDSFQQQLKIIYKNPDDFFEFYSKVPHSPSLSLFYFYFIQKERNEISVSLFVVVVVCIQYDGPYSISI